MNVFDLAAKLTLDSTEYDSGLEKASDAAKKLNGVANKMLGVGAAVGAAAIAGAVSFGKAALKSGMQFDAAMSQVAATMGIAVDEIGELRDFALEMGSTTAFTATQAAEALNYMALAGYDADKSMSMLPTVLNLAAAGGMDLARASDMVTDAESALGLSTQETAAMVDQMAKAASRSNTSVAQLGEAFLTIGGTATFMSGGTDRLATVLGILADNGIKGSEAGTHLRNMLLKLSAPTKEGQAVIDNLGLSIFDADGKMRDMQDIITDLGEAMDGMTDEAKIQAISDLFNARDVAAVNALLNTSTERWNELGAAIVNSSGAAGQMAETQLDNLSGDITLMNSAVEGLQVQFSDGLTPALRQAVSGFTALISKRETQAFFLQIGQAVGNVAKAMTRWASNALPRVIDYFKRGAPAIKAGAAALGLFVVAVQATVNPLGALLTALAAVTGAFALNALGADNARRKYTSLTDEQLESVQMANDELEAYHEMQSQRDKAVLGIIDETKHTRDLWSELQTLVDANGKVKEGNEELAANIVKELSGALGIEISIVDGQIQKYDELADSIENVIQKKRAQRLLEAHEQGYTEAAQGREQVSLDIYNAQQDVAALQAEVSAAKAAVDAAQAAGGSIFGNHMLRRATNEYNAKQTALAEAQSDLSDLQQLEQEYVQTMTAYSNAERAILEGDYETASRILEQDALNRAKHHVEVGQVSEENIEDMRTHAAAAKAAADRYLQELEAGTEGYTDAEYEKLKTASDEWANTLAEAEGIAASAGTDVATAFADGIAGGLGAVNGAVAALNNAVSALGGAGGHQHAIGADYIPYNGYPAILHRGEAVLTAREAEEWRRGSSGSGRQVVNNFTFNGVAQSDLDMIVAYVNRGLA